MKAIETVKKKALAFTPLLLESKQIDPEVKEYKNKLRNFGIKNSTSKKLDEGIQKVEQVKEESLKKQALNILIKAFAPFSIVSYGTLDQVCLDHELVMANVRNYDRPVPDENLLDMDNFMEMLGMLERDVSDKVTVLRNNYFTFANHRDSGQSLRSVDTTKMFKIAAPVDHFEMDKAYEKIGNEFGSMGCSKPAFKYTPKIHKPKPQLDPIVFMPIRFMNKTFCVIVTAWDKVADDSRILSKI